MFAVVIALPATIATFVGAGMLAASTHKHRQLFLAAWTVTLFGLSTVLGGMTIGFAVGFSEALFRGLQVGGGLTAPLWLALGVVTLIARQVQVRFGAWLLVASYSIVAVVILFFDPVVGTFGTTLPGPDHYDILPRILLGGAHLIAVAALVAATAITALRTRERDPEALEMLIPIALLAGAGVLVVGGMGGYLPDVLTVIAIAAAAGLVWYGAYRATASLDAPAIDVSRGGEVAAPPPRGRGRRRRGTRRRSGPSTSRPEDEPLDYQPLGAVEVEPDDVPPPRPDPDAAHRSARREAQARPVSRSRGVKPYGHITVYTLRDGQEEAFDRLAEAAVRAVQELEPDTLIYACHTTKHAPQQRVFYQLYRDRKAYQEHERQPHIQRFLTEGRPYVRATKVIELKLGPAKVVPPPT